MSDPEAIDNGGPDMSAHAACSPSSAAMWLACPASVTLTKDMTRPSSKFAREGTAAHTVAEMTLKGDIFLPDKVTVEGDEFIVSPRHVPGPEPLRQYVQSLMGPAGSLGVSRKAPRRPRHLRHGLGHARLRRVSPSDELHVVDLKFGKGVAVDPDGPQLRLYALGLADFVRSSTAATPASL